MKHYFLDVRFWQPKNKAQAVVSEIAGVFIYNLVDDVQLEVIKKHLANEIERVNKLYSRCRDMQFHYIDHRDVGGEQAFGIDDVFIMSIIQIQSYRLSEPIQVSSCQNPESST
nr:hypothetical protein [uncultured Draconibacterium sp.]